MKQKEEIYARQFYQELKNEFPGKQSTVLKFLRLTKQTNPSIDISWKPAGTQSECSIAKGSRRCNIHCFDIDRTDLKFKGPEFYIHFKAGGKAIATGRTFDKRKTIEAVKMWIQNNTMEELYAQFSFIDEKKRQLEKIRSDINTLNSQLLELSQNKVVEENFSSYSLRFRHENRSCRIYYYGYEPNPRYIFNWDDCLIFETSGSDIERFGLLIKKWVFDRAMPSSLNKEFPEIDFGKLAEYYEKGSGIEGEFMLSWDRIEKFYTELEFDKKAEILGLIKQMREKGFDKIFRAGTSLYTLVLSRSRRHGLRSNQDSISFSFHYIKSAMEVWTQKGESFTFDKIEYSYTIEKLLKIIERESID